MNPYKNMMEVLDCFVRLHVLRTKPPKAEAKVDEATKQEDYYRAFRTNVLLAWTLSNVGFSYRFLWFYSDII